MAVTPRSNAGHDDNWVPTLIGVSTTDGKTPVPAEVDPSTGQLQVSGTGGGSGDTQYTQGGATVANPTGTAEIWFDASGNPKGVTPSQPLPSNITDGTNAANVIVGTTGNGLQTAGTTLSVPFTTTTSQAVASTDVGNYKSVSLQITSQGTTSSVAFQQSNDNTNWVSVALVRSDTGTNGPGTSTSASGLAYIGGITSRYFRLNVTGITGGTTAGTVIFSTLSTVPTSIGVVQGSSFSVGSSNATGSAVPANAFFQGAQNVSGNLVGVQIANAASGTSGNNLLGIGVLGFDGTNYQRVGVGAEKGLYVSNQASAAGGYSFSNITSATTTVIKSGSGVLHALVVNTPVASGTITMYDNTSATGTKIGTITNPLTLLQMGPLNATYDVQFSTGLTIVTTGTQDITLSWK